MGTWEEKITTDEFKLKYISFQLEHLKEKGINKDEFINRIETIINK